MELGESNYALISSPYDSFMRKHLQHYGYFTGRSEIIKKYGFVPSKSQLISSSSDSESSSGDEDQAKYKGKPFVPDRRIPVRQTRLSYSLNVRGQNDEGSFEPRWPIEIEVLTEGRVKHINVPPQQPELFYKPTTGHMPFVRSYDENNGRVVFNYSPETCGYFIRSRIGGNREGCRPAAVTIRNSEDTTVLFESRFESGNLMKAVQVGEFEYELYLRYDLYTKRNTQWFYFRLQNIRTNRRYRFTIVNFFKPTSLYSSGMKPLMYSVNDAENRGIGWRRWGEEIVYYRNNLPTPDNPSSNMYSLTWTCKFPNDNDTYYFAHCYPYTYSDLQDYLNDIQNDHIKSQYCKQKVLCRTLAGNFIYLLTITSPTTSISSINVSTSPEQQIKKGVVVTARVHPGETNASWMMKGLLDFLLSDSADAKVLRDNFIFKIIPMLNPDGVIVGNYRCSLSGRDLNRNYKTILKDAYPSIWHTREMIKRFMSETELILYCDFHGHSRKQNVFIYGCENKHLPNERLKERIFPAMLSKNDPAKFSFCSCKFKVQKNKEGTGRVVMWAMGILNSYTLEATFCGSTQQDRTGHQFTTEDLESIGYHFLDSLLDYCDPDHTKRDRILHELEDTIRHTIQMKLLSRGINATSLDDIDLDQWSSEDDSSDDGGSDSSIDDGLPKHLEVIAAAKIQLKKTRKKKSTTKASKESKRKDEIDKENIDKVDDTRKPTPPSTQRPDNNSDSIRYDGSNETNNRPSRWPVLSRTNNVTNRMTPSDEKAQRSQAEYYKILTRDVPLNKKEKRQLSRPLSDDDILLTSSSLFPSQQSSTKKACEPGIERESVPNATSLSTTMYPLLASTSRIDEDNSVEVIIDTEGELDISRITTGNQSDDGRQQINNYVTNRVSTHLNERFLGIPRSQGRPKSSTVINLQNRSILDIRAIQPPIQTSNPKRISEQYQQQRQRLATGGGKQSSAELVDKSNCLTTRSLAMPGNEKKADETSSNHENSSSTTEKLLPLRPDNIPINLVSRYEPATLNHLTSLNRIQTIPGMNAILGQTGSGKSSLLDILADRKDRQGLTGQVLMDGQPQGSDFKYRVGYVVQDDILSGTLTVRENLAFSANVRLPQNVSTKAKKSIIDEVIRQLDLEKCADSNVGNEFQRGVSGGERKRTNIGMELVLSPNVLFLDEPTTGLDSSTARNIMEHLHQLSRSGRTIIFSIHQPRYSIFKLFDTLFVIAAGHCIYHGPTSDVLPFFISIGFTCEEHDNPADFILDICQGDYRSVLSSIEYSNEIEPEKQKSQFAHDLYKFYVQSSVYIAIKKQIDGMNNFTNGSPVVTIDTPQLPKKSRLQEIFYVSQRTFRNAFRNPALVGMQTAMSIFLGVLIGLIYMNTDRSLDSGLKNRIGAIFFIVTNQVFGSLSALDVFIKERNLFQHENASGYYHVSTYFISKLICDIIPLRTIPSVLFSVIAYFMIGFQQTFTKYFIFFFGILTTTLCSSSLCFVISASVQVFGVANVVAAMFCVLTLVFSGYLVEIESVVIFLSWIKWISIFRYSTNIFSINEFSGLQLCLPNNTDICPVDGRKILKDQKIDYSSEWDLWKNFIALGGIMLGFLILTYIQLRRMKKTK
ncbi:unnamed protein product [Rotaria sp. Silwood1]|nr:unnamed protein product [Rotaria sp. Silwood1]